jgi:signal transduction histidine kinase
MAVSADGAELVLGESVRVPAGHRRITIRFAGLSLSVPERVRFRYRLEGFDRSWSEPIAARDAVYTNLGPGSYRFRVAASNRAGLWSGAEASLRVVIEPAVWQTWWFRLAAALSAVLALFGAYRLRLRRLAGRLNMRFEERLAERTRIAQELHDTLLQGVLSASMQLHLAVDELPEESPHKPRLGRVLALMGHVIGEARNAVRGLRSPEGPADDLEQAFSRIQQELGLPADGRFRVVVEGAARPLHPVIRDEVYRIGREALVNAFRHSRAHSIEVELRYTPAQLRVLVRDDGRGIDPEVLRSGREGHWGLAGMRERAEKIGARLRLWSRASAGTEVELSVPGHVAYPPAAARRAGEREDGLPRSR